MTRALLVLVVLLACSASVADARSNLRAARNPTQTQGTLTPGCTERELADGACGVQAGAPPAMTDAEILSSVGAAASSLTKQEVACTNLAAIGEGAGGVVKDSCRVYQTTAPVTLFRAYTDPQVDGKAKAVGGYWSFQDIKAAFPDKAAYMRAYGICPGWNDGQKVIKCTFPPGLRLVLGQTESVYNGICANKKYTDLATFTAAERSVALPRERTVQVWLNMFDETAGGLASFKTGFNLAAPGSTLAKELNNQPVTCETLPY